MIHVLKHLSSARLAGLFGLLMLLAGGASSQPYRLQPGDVLTLMVVGLQELNRDIRIEADGRAYFPIIGAVEVSGSTLDEARDRVTSAYATASNPLADATQTAVRPIRSNQIYVTVAEYRPIYVSGVGVFPTTVDFRPGLTLMQTVILAGVSAVEAGGDLMQTQQQSNALLVELARTRARIWSLKSLLGTATERDYDSIFVANIAAIDEIASAEKALAEARTSDLERESGVIAENLERAKARLDALVEQKASEQEGAELDQQITENIRELTRLAEVRRAAIASASRVLEIEVTIEDVRTEISELQAEEAALESEQRSEALKELSEQLSQAEQLRAELSVLRAVAGVSGRDLMAVISRDGETLAPRTVGADAAALQPGDVVSLVYAPSDTSDD